MKIDQPPRDTLWRITHSWIADHPTFIATDSLPELRSRVAALIREGNKFRGEKKQIKDLSFRYETDERDHVNVVLVQFVGYTGRTLRAMRLERDDCDHNFVEAVDDHGQLLEPARDTCVNCGKTR